MDGTPVLRSDWHPDVPDHRDLVPEAQRVVELLRSLPMAESTGLPESVDLREFCGESLRSVGEATSTVLAAASLIEYFERRALGRAQRLSRDFLQRASDRFAGTPVGAASDLRSAWKTVARFGVATQSRWERATRRRTDEAERDPLDAWAFGLVERFDELTYVRLDPPQASPSAVLDRVRGFLAAGFPAAFGFSVPASLGAEADIPLRPAWDGVVGGHAAVAVGYDDARRPGGALLVRTGWDPPWGEAGCGWLPYAYVLSGLALDFWTVLRPAWLASGEFARPSL